MLYHTAWCIMTLWRLEIKRWKGGKYNANLHLSLLGLFVPREDGKSGGIQNSDWLV